MGTHASWPKRNVRCGTGRGGCFTISTEDVQCDSTYELTEPRSSLKACGARRGEDGAMNVKGWDYPFVLILALIFILSSSSCSIFPLLFA